METLQEKQAIDYDKLIKEYGEIMSAYYRHLEEDFYDVFNSVRKGTELTHGFISRKVRDIEISAMNFLRYRRMLSETNARKKGFITD